MIGRGLTLPNPILVASGTFGYGVEYGDIVDVNRLGGICCKGTTLRSRIGNPTPRVAETPGGMLNSIGLQNPGVDAVLAKYSETWAGWTVPVIVNVAGESVADYVEVVRRMDGVPGIAGIELNISCPNVGKGGLQFAIDAGAAASVTAAVRRVTDLPLLVKLSPNVADVRPIARAIADAGADALTAINTLSGIAVGPARDRPFLGNTYGGLSGPALKPVALLLCFTLSFGEPMQATPVIPPKPELYELPLASSRYGLPVEYERALAVFEEARRDYQHGKPDKAAPKFVEVAQLVKAPKAETTYSKSFAQMRAVAYKDASIAFKQAGEPEERKKALTAALKADPENKDTLQALLGK